MNNQPNSGIIYLCRWGTLPSLSFKRQKHIKGVGSLKQHRKFLTIIVVFFALFSVGATTAIINPETAQAATHVYVTETGKHYFYHKGNKGLNRAKKIYKVTLSAAKKRGLTLAKTDYKPGKRKVVKKTTVKKAKAATKKAKKSAGKYVTSGKYKVKVLNSNKPGFSKATLSLKKGAWQKFGNLDRLNRATTANAMLNKKLMPKGEREALYVNPTAWHNKKIKTGWLYNRSHLIGYQLTGQNNNLKNLITGTRELNDPGMVKYENKVASYLKSSKKHYIRYQVKPVFKGNNLLASGVQMKAQSIHSNAVRFSVYLPNTQPGMKLNYATGYSKVS